MTKMEIIESDKLSAIIDRLDALDRKLAAVDMTAKSEWLSITDYASKMGKSEDTVRRWIRDGTLEVSMFGRKRLIQLIGNEPQEFKPTKRYIPKAVRKFVLERDNNLCAYCGKTEQPMSIDHIHPISKGGSNDPDNLTASCRSCNSQKNARTLDQWNGPTQ